MGVGISAVMIAILIGSLTGLVSGFVGKTPDLLTMFAMDVLLAFPALLLAIAVVALVGPGLRNSLLAITIVSIPVYARIARSTVLSIKQQEYINAAYAVGAPSTRILFRHILPNSLSPILVQGTSGRDRNPGIAALGFLGLGQQPPYPEWGAMLADGVKYLTSGAWWVLVFPGLAIMLTVLGLNLLGDGLRDVLGRGCACDGWMKKPKIFSLLIVPVMVVACARPATPAAPTVTERPSYHSVRADRGTQACSGRVDRGGRSRGDPQQLRGRELRIRRQAQVD